MRIVPWIPPLYRDRAAAGRALADAVRAATVEGAVVVGIARGGVAVAAELARVVGSPLAAVDVERVNVGGRRLGAVTARGPAYLRPDHGVDAADVEAAVARARRAAAALDERIGATAPLVADCAVLLVDDGVISGLTLAAACRWAHAEAASQVVAATPVAHAGGVARLQAEADAVVCPHTLDEIAVVGQAYDSFDPLDEWYVGALLAEAAAAAREDGGNA